MQDKLTMLYPQWQGGGNDKSTYYGAIEIEKLYLKNCKYEKIEVSTDETKLVQHANIIGYHVITEQMNRARVLLNETQPKKIFSIGGGCDADIPSLAYLNHLYKGNLTVLWFDAHGDLNTPVESTSKLFYGMPLRTLLGDGDTELISKIKRRLMPEQIIHLGGRALDAMEKNFFDSKNIKQFSTEELECNSESILKWIEMNGKDHIYVHLDLDVIDPEEFPYVPLPEKNGMKLKTLCSILTNLKENFDMVGMGLYEYNPVESETYFMRFLMNMGEHF